MTEKIFAKFDIFKNSHILTKFIFFFPLAYLTGPLLTDLLILIYCGFFFFYLFQDKINLKKFSEIKYLIFASFLFWIFSLTNTIMETNTLKETFKSFFFLRFMLFFILLYYVLKEFSKKSEFFLLKNILIICLLIISASIYIQFLFHQISSGNILDRYSGIFFSELIAGGIIFKFLSIYFILQIFLNRKVSYEDFLLFLVILPALILSNERVNTLFCIILVCLIFFIYLKTSSKIKLILFLGLTSMILILFFNNNEVKKRYLQFSAYIYNTINIHLIQKQIDIRSKFNLDEDSFVLVQNLDYFEIIKSGFQVGYNKPIFGVGFRNYRNECPKLLETKNCNLHPHNYYSEIFAENGFVGLSLIIFILTYILILSLKKKKYYNSIILIILFFPIMTTGSFFNNYVAALNFLILGLITLTSNYSKEIKN